MTSHAQQPHQRTDPAQWSTSEVAEDLIAQLECAVSGPMSATDVLEMLRHQGLSHEVASDLLSSVQSIASPPAEPPEEDPPAVEFVSARLHLRAHGPEASARLVDELEKQGLDKQGSQALVGQLVSLNGRQDAVLARRRRMLAVQGFTVGLLSTALLVYGGTQPPEPARWHLVTALFSAALTVYSAALWWRHR